MESCSFLAIVSFYLTTMRRFSVISLIAWVKLGVPLNIEMIFTGSIEAYVISDGVSV